MTGGNIVQCCQLGIFGPPYYSTVLAEVSPSVIIIHVCTYSVAEVVTEIRCISIRRLERSWAKYDILCLRSYHHA